MTRRLVSFDRALQPQWLDDVAALAIAGVPRPTARITLMDRLKAEISGAEATEKTTTVLLRIWYPPHEPDRRLRDEAGSLLQCLGPDGRLGLHWGLILVAYPFFLDVARLVGRLSRLQPTFTAVQLRRRIAEQYGERESSERARRRAVQTMIACGVLLPVSPPGKSYRVHKPRSLEDIAILRWLLSVLLHMAASDALPVDTALQAPELFPFLASGDMAALARDRRFQVAMSGDQRLLLSRSA